MGFSNEVAAKIHRKHNWGVRNDVEDRTILLRPTPVQPHPQGPRPARGSCLRTAATLISPGVAAWRGWLSHSNVHTARRLAEPTAETLAGVFDRHRMPDVMTTLRDIAFCQWRFLDAPYRNELDFYVAGPENQPTYFAVTRRVIGSDGDLTVRLLDVYGDFSDKRTCRDILLLILQDANCGRRRPGGHVRQPT